VNRYANVGSLCDLIGTIAYYQAVEDQMGALAATQKFARLFLIPGMSHCTGGPGPNSFAARTAVINWVEQGTAPASLLTTQTPTAAGPVQSLPAYPYPLMATYDGTGRVDVASSYHAALPAQPLNAHIDWLGSFSRTPASQQSKSSRRLAGPSRAPASRPHVFAKSAIEFAQSAGRPA
jgi:Tannase and feruloyl esterase